jgi:tetratricopeptide (TPR) repeat protein
MQEKLYKVKLENGRILGPLNLERIKLFIFKDVFTGGEQACLYSENNFKSINEFSEIADLFLKKTNNTLSLDSQTKNNEFTEEEKTIIYGIDEEKTVILSKRTESQKSSDEISNGSLNVELEGEGTNQNDSEATVFVDTSKLKQNYEEVLKENKFEEQKKKVIKFLNKEIVIDKKKLILIIGLGFFLILFLLPEDNKKNEIQPLPTKPIVIELPYLNEKPDVTQGQKLLEEALKHYILDSIEGYKQSARLLVKAASFDPNNVKALCLLVSSYVNLIDVVAKDENYFAVVTKLLEMARAKGVDLTELVIADVEFYLALNNLDAAYSRIVNYTTTHKETPELILYLAETVLKKKNYEGALNLLTKIDKKDWYTARIPYAFARAFYNLGNKEQAILALKETIKRSEYHTSARALLGQIYYELDKFNESLKQLNFVILNKAITPNKILAQSYFIRGKIKTAIQQEQEAIQDIQQAMKLDSSNKDYLLEYYTIKEKLGSKNPETKQKAKKYFYLAEGERALLKNNYDEAMKNFITAREIDDKDPTPFLKIGDTYVLKGDYQSARISYKKAISLQSSNKTLYPPYIRALISVYDFEEADKQLEVLKGIEDDFTIIDKLYAEKYLKQERPREALVYLKRVIGKNPADSSVYIQYADVLMMAKRFSDAAFYYSLAMQFDPLNSKAIIGYAKATAEVEGLSSAVEFLKQKEIESPKKAEIATGIGEVYYQKGDYQMALQYAMKALSYDNTYSYAYKLKGDAYYSLNNVKEALDAYSSFNAYNSVSIEGRIAAYNIYFSQKNYKAAKDEISVVIEMYPKMPGAYYRLGELYLEAKNYKSALEAAKEEIHFNPTYLPAYVLAGKVLNLMKNYQEALQYVNKALKIDGSFVEGLLVASDTNMALKNYGASKALLDRALALDSGNPQVHKRLGMLYLEMGDKLKYKQYLKAYLDLLPNAPDKDKIQKLIGQ